VGAVECRGRGRQGTALKAAIERPSAHLRGVFGTLNGMVERFRYRRHSAKRKDVTTKKKGVTKERKLLELSVSPKEE